MKNFTLTLLLLIGYSAQSQIGIGIPNPDASAVLELASKQKGFLPPRLTTTERDAIAQPALGLAIYNTTKKCLEWYLSTGWYNACGDNGIATITNYACGTLSTGIMINTIPVSGVSQTITVTVSFPGSYDISATQNGVTFSARGNFTSIGNHDIVLHAVGTPLAGGDHNFILNTSPNNCSFRRFTITTVTSTTGKTWMAYNLGATAPATSSTDAAQYGDYYQWGRSADGHEKQNSATTVIQSSGDSPGHANFIVNRTNWRSTTNVNLWQGINGTNNPCPSGFRIPTIVEWNNEFTNYGIRNNATAFSSILKLPAPGYRLNASGSYLQLGTHSNYWTSTANGSTVMYKNLSATHERTDNQTAQSNGFSIRCIKD